MSGGDDPEEWSREEARRAAVRRELRRTVADAWRERFGVWPIFIVPTSRSGVCPACGRPY